MRAEKETCLCVSLDVSVNFGRINPKLYFVFNKFKFNFLALNFVKKKIGSGSARVTCKADKALAEISNSERYGKTSCVMI